MISYSHHQFISSSVMIRLRFKICAMSVNAYIAHVDKINICLRWLHKKDKMLVEILTG